jgi:malic enzyme
VFLPLSHQVFPSIRDIRNVSVTVGVAVAKAAQKEGLTKVTSDDMYECSIP